MKYCASCKRPVLDTFFSLLLNPHFLQQALSRGSVEMVKNGDNGLDVPNYVDENVSTKVVKLIQSYVGVVNKMVWRKF